VRDIRNEGDLAGRTIVSVTAEFYGTFAVDDAGTVISWGNNAVGNLARSYNFQTGSDPVPTATSVTNVVKLSSHMHTVALTADGRVLTWGFGVYGQLGNGGTASTWQPQTVTTSGTLSGRTVVDVAAGFNHTVVVCSDGTVHGTGRNWQGCLANVSPVGSNILRFAQLSFPTNAVSVACGENSTYVIDDAGDVWGCGDNQMGQLGIPGGDKSSFTKISGSGNPQGSLFGRSDVTAVTTLLSHVLVQCADGSVHAFGNNGNGQSGIDNGYVNVFDPVDITSQFALPPV
jgi:alpha-tubulin suppressor-like RCC1 family protein